MKVRWKLLLTLLAALLALTASIGIGSVGIAPLDILRILGHQMFGLPLGENIDAITVSILWKIRLHRTLLAFLVGGALAASGTVMQSVLKNPLASSYTLGVSSGASLGAAAVIVSGFTLPLLGNLFTLPLIASVCGLATVFLAMGFSARLDRNMENQTIILVGMVLSLFVNAFLTILTSLAQDRLQQLVFWQMGSFSGRDWSHVAILFPVVLLGCLALLLFTREMDIMTFGEEQAMAVGVELKKVKLTLIILSAVLTGTSVAFVGVIGFVDLIAPHVVRKLFGSTHRLVVPVSILFGGTFMTVADLLARTVISPSELPVGAITALVGAPFFAYIFFKKRKKAQS